MADYNSSYTGAQIDAGIGKANTAYQKPSGGIPDADIASASNWNGKAAPATVLSLTLSSASWSNNAQTVSNANLIASGYSYVVSPVSTNFSDYANAQIYADDVTTDGSMTFHCESVPAGNLTVNVLRMGVT